jgi:hypothetical protein
MYNRKQLCLLAGMGLEAFKQAQRPNPETGADDLPGLSYDGGGDDHGDDGRQRYARYTAHDVLLLACAVQLAAGGGGITRAMSFANASKIICNNVRDSLMSVRKTRETGKAHFIGYAVSSDAGGANVSGTLSQIDEWLHEKPGRSSSGLYLVSPSVVLGSIEMRAADHGILWDSSVLFQGEA